MFRLLGLSKNHDQIVIAVILEPPVLKAVHVQHHARKSFRGHRLRCDPGFFRFLTKPDALEGTLHPAEAQLDSVGFQQLLVKCRTLKSKTAPGTASGPFLPAPERSRHGRAGAIGMPVCSCSRARAGRYNVIATEIQLAGALRRNGGYGQR